MHHIATTLGIQVHGVVLCAASFSASYDNPTPMVKDNLIYYVMPVISDPLASNKLLTKTYSVSLESSKQNL